jgi:hypothetical protein
MPADTTLYLSKNKAHLTDGAGNFIFMKCVVAGKTFYQPIGIESPAYEKLCTETASLKVCVQWGSGYVCQVWDDVDVCTKWELVAKAWGDIS